MINATFIDNKKGGYLYVLIDLEQKRQDVLSVK